MFTQNPFTKINNTTKFSTIFMILLIIDKVTIIFKIYIIGKWAFGAVGSALERHSRGHKFEPCNAHHFKERLWLNQ